MSLSSPTLAYLESLFPGQAVISAVAAGRCIGYADKTTRNQITGGNFPLPTFLIGGRRSVRKTDLAAFLDSLPGKRRPGRPRGSTKAAKLRAAQQSAAQL